MQLELTNSLNHNSASETSEWARAPWAAVAAGNAVVVASSLWQSVVKDAAALREMRAMAGAGLLGSPNLSEPPRLWTVKQMAKAMGLSEGGVRRLCRAWPFTLCVAHCCACKGGTRGCELRFRAEAASFWLSQRRTKRSAQ